RMLSRTMIKDWRQRWGSECPFLFVQLAPYEPGGVNWPVLWESQLVTVRSVPKTAMAVITDVGEKTDIHPKKKEPVGARLALAARKIAYGEDIVAMGPVYKGMKVEGNRVGLTFDHVGSGLERRGEKLTGVARAGGGRAVPP